MPDKVPTVSIGMPIYNDVKYVRDALESLLSQSFTDFELVISDNASTDGSSAICEEYARRDLRIKYIRQGQNMGAAANFNMVLNKARSEFFMWAASDDVWDVNYVKLMVNALCGNEKAALAFSPYTLMDEDGRFLKFRSIDYSSHNTVWRLMRFCYHYDDGCFYGMYRRRFLGQVGFPKWRWMYARTPLNGAYPVLCYVLSQGDYVLAGNDSLWFNRIHLSKQTIAQKGTYQAVSSNLIMNYAGSIFHKINVMAVCISYIYRATKSPGLSILSIFPLSFRCAYECMKITGKFIVNLFRRYLVVGFL